MNDTSIYIHWPFCVKKCPYCDFNSFVNHNTHHDDWNNAYLKVIEKHYSQHLRNKNITSIFFGGGTPSLAEPQMIENILNTLQSITTFAVDIEITLEANPTSIEKQKFQGFKNAGINRVSLGIQSLRNKNLQFLGRNHSVNEAIQAIDIVKQSFQNYSLDFIYGLPTQTCDEWQEELQEILLLNSNHLSLYQLTIENGTKFGALAKQGLLLELNENVAAEMFEMTYNMTSEYGFNRYEVSNHAKPTYESRHNLNYWHYGNYIGIGPGAHGRYTNELSERVMTIDIQQPDIWLSSVKQYNHGIKEQQVLQQNEIAIERIMMGMRTTYGIDSSLLNNKDEILNDMLKENLIHAVNDKIAATNKGMLILNSIIQQLI